MELIERYLQEIGRYLPTNKRADILSELRSSLDDTLEARNNTSPTEDEVVQVLKEMGAPRKVAASYYPEGQYLIGPELYPFFQFVLTIVLLASTGGRLIAGIASFALSQEAFDFVNQLWQILDGILPTIGSVVLIFAVLQRLNVHPEFEKKDFDPRTLPPLHKDQPISRAEKIFSVIVGTLFLAFLSQVAVNGGFTAKGGITPFTNPVLDHYFPWIALSLAIGILLDVVLLWRGHWEMSTRIARIAANIFSLIVLALLTQGHTVWLNQIGVHGLVFTPEQFSPSPSGLQILGMVSFRLAFYVAFVVTTIETFAMIVRLIRGRGNNQFLRISGMALTGK